MSIANGIKLCYIPPKMENYIYKTKPYHHQLDVLQRSWDKVNWAYFLEMGTGKSKVCIDNAAALFEQGKIDALIIIAPKGVYRNWVSIEIPAHMPDRINMEMCLWRSGANKSEKRALNNLLKPSHSLRVLVMNVESLSTGKGLRYLTAMLESSEALLAVDESTSIKSPKAARTKAIIKVANLARYRRILTGFPVTQSPMDLWSQCKFMDESLLGDCGSNFFQFQARYAVIRRQQFGAHSFNRVVGYQNLEELGVLLKNFSSRITKDECLDLPPKVYSVREVSLTPEQNRIYNELRDYALARLDDEEFMTAASVMTQLVRMQQVLSGHVKSDAGDISEIQDNRLGELMSCLAESAGKVIIWSRFRYDIKRIHAEIAKIYGTESVVTYFGDTTDDERGRAIDSFQNGSSRFFVSNPQTGGFGITLTSARTVIYFANSFDLATRMQSEDRAHRIGQSNTVNYIDLIAPKTIDERIVKALRSKMDIASMVMGEELKKWLT